MAPVERERSLEEISGAERAFEVKLGSLGGFELRPTRLFVWRGAVRDDEKVLPLAERPVGLDESRAESTIRVGSIHVRSRGNPVLTLAITGAIAVKRWANAPSAEAPPRQRSR